jgi:hypothetical protein
LTDNDICLFSVVGNPPTPGDAAVMFLVLKLTRSGGKKYNGKIVNAVPVGTSFALSDNLLFTAAHNVCEKNNPAHEIGVVQVYDGLVLISDIVVLTYECHCSDKDEDWAVYKRSTGSFTHSVLICPEHELPVKGIKIGIKDFPVGLVTVGSVTKIDLDSFHTKVSNYQVFSDSAVSRKRKFNVVETKPATAVERAIQVVGGRVTGSCGAAYFHANGKVVAFHKESVDDSREEVSTTNSYHSDRSHTSYSVGLVLCRLPKFKDWYDNNIPRTVV